ncbi:hypothetical protein C1H46_042533 [Malus baccata]|uniref:Cytochrome P450 n=1 Tax=Malus baccata TaxID=106549 RepID=A0A540KCG6_MALBA|nr:hypothetical protein C1H46_042533 [Malus baccata]
MLTPLKETLANLLQFWPFQLLLLATFLVLLYRWSSTSANASPPSPPNLPIIGNLHQVGLQIHRSLQTLSQRHGPLMLIHFGSTPVLVVSSAEAACEIMKTHNTTFANKPQIIFFKKFCYNFKDVSFAPYEARKSVPKSGKVMNLIQVFEKLVSIQSSKDPDEQNGEEEAAEEIGKKAAKWALPGL